MIYNVGKPGELMRVFDPHTGLKRPARFDILGAQECALVIARLRSDSAFEGSEIVDLEKL